MGDMYTILINEDHSFIHTNRKRIMHKSNLIDNIRFIVNQKYNDLNMLKANAVLEYETPSGKRDTVVLFQSDELYKNRVEFILPIDTRFTSEVGELKFTITFSYLTMKEDGTFVEQVRPIGSTSIFIEETGDLSSYISNSNSNLTSLAQILLQNQAILEQQKIYAEMIASERADSIAKDEETNEIYLTSNGKEIGDRIKDSDSYSDGEGVIAIDLTSDTD